MGEYCELYRVAEAVIRQLVEKEESCDYFENHQNPLMMRLAALREAYADASSFGDGIVISIG